MLACLFLFIAVGLFFVCSRARTQSTSITATVKISVCGNNVAEDGEDCDGSDLVGNSCITLGFGGGGTLSCDIACAFDTSACVPGPIENSIVVFSGKAYPGRTVTLLKDGQLAATGAADAGGDFQITISGLAAGSYNFSLYCTDRNDNKSKTLAYQITIAESETKYRSGIIIPPTIEADEDEVEAGDSLTIFGQAAPNATVRILITSDAEDDFYLTDTSNANGNYSYSLDTDSLEDGQYEANAKVTLADGSSSDYGSEADFSIEEAAVSLICSARSDLNDDGRINLVDFSILIYWLDRQSPPSDIDPYEDDDIDLRDFSILMYYWTG